MTLKSQMVDDLTAILADTGEMAEEIEFGGQTATPEGYPLTGVVHNTAFTLLSGMDFWSAQAEHRIFLQVARASLVTVPEIGALTTFQGAEVMVIDRQESVPGILTYILQ